MDTQRNQVVEAVGVPGLLKITETANVMHMKGAPEILLANTAPLALVTVAPSGGHCDLAPAVTANAPRPVTPSRRVGTTLPLVHTLGGAEFFAGSLEWGCDLLAPTLFAGECGSPHLSSRRAGKGTEFRPLPVGKHSTTLGARPGLLWDLSSSGVVALNRAIDFAIRRTIRERTMTLRTGDVLGFRETDIPASNGTISPTVPVGGEGRATNQAIAFHTTIIPRLPRAEGKQTAAALAELPLFAL